MKRTIAPASRQRILQENIVLKIQEINRQLGVRVILGIDPKDYASNAQVILEAYNRINIKRLPLGEIENYEKEQTHPLPFDVPLRAKINFRLKIIDPISYKLLGYAENLKEEKYAKSLLDINTEDDSVKNIYKIDFDNHEHPILYLNPELKTVAKNLKPVLAEMAFKDILNYLLFQEHEQEIYDHKWFVFANQFHKYVQQEEINDDEYRKNWMSEVLCKFTQKHKLVKSLIKGFEAND